jgi:hypothetical protein
MLRATRRVEIARVVHVSALAAHLDTPQGAGVAVIKDEGKP